MNHNEPIEVDPEEVELFQDTRSNGDTIYRVVHIDDCRVLARSNEHLKQTGRRHYRCDFRDHFDSYVIEGRYESVEESENAPAKPEQVEATEYDWSEISGIGKKTNQKLREAGVKTDHDLASMDDSKIIEVYGMSELKLDKMWTHTQ